MTDISSFPWAFVIVFSLIGFIISVFPIRNHLKAIYVNKTELFTEKTKTELFDGITNKENDNKSQIIFFNSKPSHIFLSIAVLICGAIAFSNVFLPAFSVQNLIIGIYTFLPTFLLFIILIFSQNKRNSGEMPRIKISKTLGIITSLMTTLPIGIYLIVKFITDSTSIFYASSSFEVYSGFFGEVASFLGGFMPWLVFVCLVSSLMFFFGQWICSLIAISYTNYKIIDSDSFVEIYKPEHKKMTANQIIMKIIFIVLSVLFVLSFISSKSFISAGGFSVSSNEILRTYLGDAASIMVSTESKHTVLLFIQWFTLTCLLFVEFYIVCNLTKNVIMAISNRSHASLEDLSKSLKGLLIAYPIFVIVEIFIVLLWSWTYEIPLEFSFGFSNVVSLLLYILLIIFKDMVTIKKDKLMISDLGKFTVKEGETVVTSKQIPKEIIFTHIVIPYGVKEIDFLTFAHMAKLMEVRIPDSTISFGKKAFAYCPNLQDIYYSGTKEQWEAIEKGEEWNEYTGEYTVHCSDGDVSK